MPDAIPTFFDGWPAGVETRPYQRRIVAEAVALLAGDGRTALPSVMIESPTGSGKTVMGLAVAAALVARFGYRVGWAAMRRNLLAQAEVE